LKDDSKNGDINEINNGKEDSVKDNVTEIQGNDNSLTNSTSSEPNGDKLDTNKDSMKNNTMEAQGGSNGDSTNGETEETKESNVSMNNQNMQDVGSNENSMNNQTTGTGDDIISTTTDTESNTSKEVTSFISNLEEKSPGTQEFQSFFQKLKDYMKYLCPVSSTFEAKDSRSYMSEMISMATKLSDAMAVLQAKKSGSGQVRLIKTIL